MTEQEIEQLIKDKSNINKQIMREIDILTTLLNEANEGDSAGRSNGLDYSLKRISKPEAKLN
jgi:hypothetical protein